VKQSNEFSGSIKFWRNPSVAAQLTAFSEGLSAMALVVTEDITWDSILVRLEFAQLRNQDLIPGRDKSCSFSPQLPRHEALHLHLKPKLRCG
jgi:hypothetical protein